MGNRLRDLRLSRSLASQQMVDCVKELYPKYDKPLQSKCESSDVYGVELRRDALEKLYKEFDPDELQKFRRSADRHKLTCRIYCRLEDDVYKRLLAQIRQDGFKSVQEWVTDQVLAYINARCL